VPVCPVVKKKKNMERLGVGVGERKLGERKQKTNKTKQSKQQQQQQQVNTFSKGMFFVWDPKDSSLNDC